MPVKVVKISRKYLNFGTYIGREWAGNGESLFHNPYHIGPDGSRAEVIAKFAEYWYSPQQKFLREAALTHIAQHATLGCWCKPRDCHGDIIAGYLNWKRQEPRLW
jgi:hypothetical protein